MRASRRRFLQLSTAVSAVQLKIPSVVSAQALPVSVSAALVEAGSGPGLRFAKRCRRSGVEVHEIRDDVTPVWYRILDLQWREAPAAIAGLTRWPALFCLDVLARQHSLRVVHHVIHRTADSAPVTHEVVGPSFGCSASELRAAESVWPEIVAARLVSIPPVAQAPAFRRNYMPAADDDLPTSLHSWVIAPVSING